MGFSDGRSKLGTCLTVGRSHHGRGDRPPLLDRLGEIRGGEFIGDLGLPRWKIDISQHNDGHLVVGIVREISIEAVDSSGVLDHLVLVRDSDKQAESVVVLSGVVIFSNEDGFSALAPNMASSHLSRSSVVE